MARKHPFWKFWFWFGANPMWDVLKWIGGTAVVNSIWTVLKAEVHHHPVDWILFTLFIIVGVVLTAIAVYFQPSKAEEDAPIPTPLGDVEAIAFGGRDTLEEVQAEQARVLALGNQLDGVFNLLQVEAVRLASDLEAFMNRIGDKPGSPPGSDWDAIWEHGHKGGGRIWVVRMQAEYEQDYSPRVNAFIGKLERDTGRQNRRLRAYKDHVHDFSNINTIRAQLWKEALYPLTIDFAGE